MKDSGIHDKAVLTVSADRESHIYKMGETISFSVLSGGLRSPAAADYEIRRASGELIQSGAAEIGARINVGADKPGFLNIRVKSGALTAEAAVAADPHLIRPSAPPPADFDEFWRGKLAELAKVPLSPVFRKITPPDKESIREWSRKFPFFGREIMPFASIELFDVETETLDGNPARGYLAFPAGAMERSLPAALFTHASGVYDSDLMKVCAGAHRGLLCMDVNAHGVLNGQPAEYYERLAAEMKRPGESVYKKGGMNRDTLYFTQMFLRHRRALDLLCSRPEWSGHDLIVRGCSQGGTLALACAALDPRVTRVCAGVPSLCDVTHPGSVGKWLDADASGADTRRAKEAAAYVSVSNFAPRIKARAYFTAAFLDRSCDPETVYAAHNAYGGPKKIYNGPLAGHSDIPREIHYDDFTGFMTEMA